MSKWGIEEKETLDAINEIGLSGNILDVTAGDGRFINELLKRSQSVTAIDINKEELDYLKNNYHKEYSNKLNIEIVDITKAFPYEENLFDGIFCTGTLHLFNKDTIGDYSDKTILDLGCGIGCFTYELANKAKRVARNRYF